VRPGSALPFGLITFGFVIAAYGAGAIVGHYPAGWYLVAAGVAVIAYGALGLIRYRRGRPPR
jgi:hypothetical protein